MNLSDFQIGRYVTLDNTYYDPKSIPNHPQWKVLDLYRRHHEIDTFNKGVWGFLRKLKLALPLTKL